MNETSRLQKLVEEFAESVIRQTDAVATGDHQTGNRHAKRYIAAFEKLRAAGDVGREALVPLLRHRRADVRTMSATFLLRYKTEDALAVLRSEARGHGLVAFEASQAIKRWQAGEWALDE